MNDISAQPWQVLLWDPSDPSDARWLVVTVDPYGVLAPDVRPIRPAADKTVIGWVARVTGLHNPALTSLPGVLAWRIEEQRGDH